MLVPMLVIFTLMGVSMGSCRCNHGHLQHMDLSEGLYKGHKGCHKHMVLSVLLK